jgi:hypothetical protein
MSGSNILATILIVAIVILAIYLLDPTFGGLLRKSEGFTDAATPVTVPAGGKATTTSTGEKKVPMDIAGMIQEVATKQAEHVAQTGEGFADLGGYESSAQFGSAEEPSGCYPRDQLTPSELLPKDTNSVWAQQNPMGNGSLKGKNFLSAGALIGVDTVGQSLRNANYQLRSEPPNPQTAVSVFMNSTIAPDMNRRTLEIA